MKSRTAVITTVVVAALAATLIVGGVHAHPHQAGPGYHSGPGDFPAGRHHSHDRHGMPSPRLFERLDLDEEQRRAIREIREARAPEFREKVRALRDAGRELHGYAWRDDFDAGRARELASAHAELQAELRVLRMTGFHEAWQVLTDGQKAELAGWRDRDEPRGHRSYGHY